MTKRKNQPPMETTTLLQHIRGHLKELRLIKINELLDDELGRLEKGEHSATETLLRLFEAQVHHQRQQRIDRRFRDSKLPERKTFAGFDFDFQPGLDRKLVLELATMGFVSRRQGVILAGNSGTGKSHIAKALALEACKHGYRVRYTTAAAMLKTLFASLADDSLDQKLKLYLNPDVLVIDEVGFDRLEREDARNAALFFKVIDGRYDKRTTVLTTNVDFEQLGDYLGDPVVTTAIVDRMVHHSTVISIKGPSWRLEQSKKLNETNSPTTNEKEVTTPKTKSNKAENKRSSRASTARPKKKGK